MLNLVGAHICAAVPNAMILETVRACVLGWYNDIVTDRIVIRDGHMELPTKPGLGTALRPELLSHPQAVVRLSE